MKNASDIKRAYAGQARHKETGNIHEIHELEKLGYGKMTVGFVLMTDMAQR